MTRTPTLILSAITIALSLSACSPAPKQADSNAASADASASQIQSESARLGDFFKASFEQDLARSPMTQSRLGIKDDYDKWDDISPEADAATRALLEERLTSSQSFDVEQLNEQERLSLALYQTDIQRRIANDEFRLHSYIMHQFSGWHIRVPSFLINIHKVNSVEDAEAYISRLRNVKVLFEQLNAQLALREEAGIFPPRWAYDQMIQASANVIQGNPFSETVNDSTILADFKDKLNALGLSNAEKGGLLADARDALRTSVQPAYQSLIDVLRKQRELSPAGDGVWRLPDGEDWYKNRLAWFTTTDLNAEQVHNLGLENVAQIHEQMRAIMQQVGFDGDLQAFFDFMREDEQFYYENTQEGRERYLREAKAYIDTMEEKIPEYFGLVPQAEMIIKRVEAFREQSAGKAFYQSPARDGSRPGIYYANLYDMNSMPTYQMEALAYHEGIPGHHMQRAIAQELDGIPEFQKYASFTVYTEGWGLYTEKLAKDMGFYEDPYSDFGRLAMALWRACRLVVDTGLHSKKWSREEAIEYLLANTPNPQNDAVKAIERYIAMPGQATAYTIGMLEILALREKAQLALGDKFTYAGFHDEVLKNGPLPLSLLEQNIDAWIARTSAAY